MNYRAFWADDPPPPSRRHGDLTVGDYDRAAQACPIRTDEGDTVATLAFDLMGGYRIRGVGQWADIVLVRESTASAIASFRQHQRRQQAREADRDRAEDRAFARTTTERDHGALATWRTPR